MHAGTHDDRDSGRGARRPPLRLCAALLLAAAPFVGDDAAAGEATNLDVDHRCTTATAPHDVSVRTLDPADDAAVQGDSGESDVDRAEGSRDDGAGGETLVVTVTY